MTCDSMRDLRDTLTQCRILQPDTNSTPTLRPMIPSGFVQRIATHIY
jgi:hypothetical protein